MKFGLFGGAVAKPPAVVQCHGEGSSRTTPARSQDSDHFVSLVNSVVEAEQLGFASVFLVEHHFTGTAQISATLNLLTFIAARTSCIRLGTAVTVLPWHNPVLLAEQVTTLDVLSGGRFDFGIGRGYRPSEFDWFCVPQSEADERYRESLDLLRMALTSDRRFSHRSANWQFKDIVVEPAPVQRPHPPFWVAAGKPASLQAAAVEGHCLLLDQFATFDVALERMNIYREAVMGSGNRFAPETVALARAVRIVDNDAEREAAFTARIAQLGSMNRLAAGQDGRNRSSMMSDPDLFRAAQAGSLIGTPEEIVEQLARLRDAGVDYVLAAGLLSDDTQLRRFAESIMPHFRD